MPVARLRKSRWTPVYSWLDFLPLLILMDSFKRPAALPLPAIQAMQWLSFSCDEVEPLCRHEQGAARGEPAGENPALSLRAARLSPVGDHAIVTIAEQTFPSGNSKRQNALKLVVTGLVCHIHAACKQREAA